MGFFSRLFARPDDASARSVQAALDAGDVERALDTSREALEAVPHDPALLRVTGAALLRNGDPVSADLFLRAAQAPSDPACLFELGSHLLSRESPRLACAMLRAALEHAPLDAVVRSELAIAQARAGRPGEAIETLALHPCLAEDPGALFELAWSSLLVGDLDTARGVRDELGAVGVPRTLLAKLDCALARAGVPPASDPPDARDFYFLEHGGLLLVNGRHRAARPDVAAVTARAGALLASLLPRPRRVVPASPDDADLARALASASDAELLASPPASGLPACVVVARRAAELASIADRFTPDVLGFALTLDWSKSLAYAPELVGVMSRLDGGDVVSPDATLDAFVEPRRAHLPPRGRRVPTAYIPDAPLPWV